MRKLATKEILSAFSKKEAKNMKVPNLDEIDWDNIDFLSWHHSSGHLSYLVLDDNGELRGVVLRRGKPGNNKVAKMCSLCKTVHGNTGVILFSGTLKNDASRAKSVFACADLCCGQRMRGLVPLGANQMGETISQEKKIERLQEGVKKFIDSLYS